MKRSTLDGLRQSRIGGGRSGSRHVGVIRHFGRLHFGRRMEVVLVLLLAIARHERRRRRARSGATTIVAARLGHLVAGVLDADAAAVRREQVGALQRDQSLGRAAHVSVLDEGYRSTTFVVHAQATVAGKTVFHHTKEKKKKQGVNENVRTARRR